MKTCTVSIIQYFLGSLESSVEIEKLQEPITPAFIHLLSRREIIEILVMMYGDRDQVKKAHPNFEEEPNDMLLFEYIRDEYYILQYFKNIVLKQYIL